MQKVNTSHTVKFLIRDPERSLAHVWRAPKVSCPRLKSPKGLLSTFEEPQRSLVHVWRAPKVSRPRLKSPKGLLPNVCLFRRRLPTVRWSWVLERWSAWRRSADSCQTSFARKLTPLRRSRLNDARWRPSCLKWNSTETQPARNSGRDTWSIDVVHIT